jgi:3-oxoacyl-[acyl-carrier protein] reductase
MKGRVALITGAGQGLGTAFAKHFAERGTKVVIAEKNPETGASTAKEINQSGAAALFVETDVANSSSVQNAVDSCLSEFGGLDILINNAALLSQLRQCSLEEITDEEWDQVMKVNVTGIFYAIRAAAPIMKKMVGGG